MADPKALIKTPLMKRLTQVMSYGFTGGFFAPQNPLPPQYPETAGRRLDYIAGYNISTRPRRDSGVDFQALRNFAQFYDILRILIEKRKDQISNFEWTIGPTDEAVEAGKDTDELNKLAEKATNFFKYPDGRYPWNLWLKSVIEDMLVLDAVVFWPIYKGKEILRLETVDPATIKLIIDESGRRPEPPYPAYQQVLHGVPTSNYLQSELMYFISNPASNRIYGLGCVERILITIQIGLRREMSQLQMFTDGNVPAALCGLPDTWDAKQIGIFQTAFDSMLAGDTAARRRMMFVPGDAAKNVHELVSQEATLKSEFDEWLIRIMCFTFGINPGPFIKELTRATAFTAQQEARDEGIAPVLNFLKTMIDHIIRRALMMEDIEFKWSMEVENDPQTQASIDDIQLKNASRTVNELRQRDGLDPIKGGDVPLIYTAQGGIPFKTIADGSAQHLQPPPTPVIAPPGQNGPGGGPFGGKGPGGAAPPGKKAMPKNKQRVGNNPKQQQNPNQKTPKSGAKNPAQKWEAGTGSSGFFRKGVKTFRY